ncbi:hypothetical protein Back11_10440 [Paenibacillus baekrokdamisoli]|uniref:TM2 domain-containing protein n=1 Tax=Paenibacillus baekrokdamisoli TaxID=1712516 RepID=A0A3G9J9Q5_9BACL|nr:DUF6677 family protein [Paenibacillus baekrokdamisoli]MBB3067108.1 TM2 domain-containing membrane protein YozV [Paenibacillus baekrokdamisoli]BBH19699.1 hypothetical protein Back11_10440 [Paenibacillus baekrokdamisoli]
MNPYPNGYKIRKSKALTVLLSMMFPGAGHLYLGLMPRGLSFMLVFILNIVLIVFAAQGSFPFHVAIVTFMALLLPVSYLLNIFDGLQQVNQINQNQQAFEANEAMNPFMN